MLSLILSFLTSQSFLLNMSQIFSPFTDVSLELFLLLSLKNYINIINFFLKCTLCNCFSVIISTPHTKCHTRACKNNHHFLAERWDHGVRIPFYFRVQVLPFAYVLQLKNHSFCVVPKIASIKLLFVWFLRGIACIWGYG